MTQPYSLHIGNCLDVLKTLDAESIDAIVTDPPYGLAFMGKKWDYDVPSTDIWQECLRVLKPGGHLLAFAGTRTQHRMAVRIEDAGFEIRDMIAWVYGSGFPKSLDVSKAIDKRGGVSADFASFRDAVKDAMRRSGVSCSQLQEALGNFMISHYLTARSQPAVPNYRDYIIIRDTVGLGDDFDYLFAPEAEREVVGVQKNAMSGWDMNGGTQFKNRNITAPATPAARQWAGWGTALKPALEPITVARKPFIGRVAGNVLAHGTGALNVDGCRVGTEGRWPANLIHDGSEDVVGMFPETGPSKAAIKRNRSGMGVHDSEKGTFGKGDVFGGYDDAGGSAARFFYCAKASAKGRDEGVAGVAGVGALRDNGRQSRPRKNTHPTVKPTDLMRYLCRLVTPPGGTILDPFMGSGSTGVAALREGFKFIGIELNAEYAEIARNRIENELNKAPLFANA